MNPSSFPQYLHYNPMHNAGFMKVGQPYGPGDFLESLGRRRRCSYYPETAFFNAFQGQLFPSFVDSRFCYRKAANLNAFEGQFFPYSAESQLFYRLIPQSCSHEFQDFQYFVVMDFEATCDKEKIPQPQEIIEFPSVIVNATTGELEACFQTYVRPTHNQQLTDFCKDLTGIQQNQVDTGVTLSEALLSHDEWLEKMGIKKTNFAVVTWGDWDCRVMLESECQHKKIRKPSYFNRWINLRIPFRKVFGNLRCNLKQAVELAGLNWQGRPHCGLDDAKNTAHLLVRLMQRGAKFAITDSLPAESFTGKKMKQFSSSSQMFSL